MQSKLKGNEQTEWARSLIRMAPVRPNTNWVIIWRFCNKMTKSKNCKQLYVIGKWCHGQRRAQRYQLTLILSFSFNTCFHRIEIRREAISNFMPIDWFVWSSRRVWINCPIPIVRWWRQLVPYTMDSSKWRAISHPDKVFKVQIHFVTDINPAIAVFRLCVLERPWNKVFATAVDRFELEKF